MGDVEDMPLVDAFRYVDEIADLSASREEFSIYVSGGEPFLRFHDLLAVVLHAKKRGATQVSCVTNGFWGSEPATARQHITELRDSGLSQICFSLDDFHQEYIPLESVLAALAACREVELGFAIKSTVTRGTRRLPKILSELGNLLLDIYVPIQEIAYVPQLNTGDKIPNDEWLVQEQMPSEPCPELRVLAVLPDGTTYPCCGSGWTQRLIVGNASVEPIVDLMHKVRDGALFTLLREKGPARFMPYFTRAGCPVPRLLYVNRCHLCRTVLDHPQSERIIQLALAD